MKEQIVISGISGRFPQSDNLEEFWKNLINGVDMVTTDARRWPTGYLGLPERKGTLKTDLTHFDASFFGIFPAQAERVDPQIRQLLEVAFEAIVDAGINPTEIRGSNVGVFVGASAHDTFEACRKHPDLASGHDITGSACCMLANRLSYAFDLRGPSFCIDTFCSSSLMALHQGMAAIRAGECDSAIIAGVNLLLNPMTSLQIQRLGGLSLDGKCKSFDASGDGFVRAEAIVAVFIQKVDMARRSYCTLLHSKTNTDGFKARGVAYPAGPIQQKLMEEIYAEAGVDPSTVFYVEPHGTGTAAGDPQEVNAITNAFTKTRNSESPLLIGSTKSNMGHAEPAAALCSLVKIVLSLRAGIIPANLHFLTPNPNIPGLLDGRVQVVIKNTPIRGDLIGINSTGLGGSNIHVIIQVNAAKNRRTETETGRSSTPVLIPFSGRTDIAVKYTLDQISQYEENVDLIALLHKISEHTIPQHYYRGYTIHMDESDLEPTVDIIQNASNEIPPPLWFVFSGMGTLWCGMMDGLMEFELFSESILKSTEILKPFGLDLLEIMVNGTEEQLDKNMGTCFIAMGMALIRLLDALGLKPEGFLGHSAGELLCAYMDGCLSQEEALISYYYKDIAVLDCSGGAMAAIGLTWEQAESRCPEGVYPACHNAVNSVTISGPVNKVAEFVAELKSEGIFARQVLTGGIAYHSPYLAPILPNLEAHVKATAKNLKLRSNRWVSTSIPEEDWDKPESIKTGSADYVINNIKSPVLFQGALKYIPANAVVLEVSAHSLFVSMLRKALPETAVVLGLIRKGEGNNAVQFLTAVGKLYQLGFNPKVSALYPPVRFPVPADTPMIAPLIKWDHSTTYSLPDYLFNGNSAGTIVNICLKNEEDAFLSGHVVDGRTIFPATGYLILAWKQFASINGNIWERFPVQFKNVRFERAAIIPKTGTLKLEINMEGKTGEFEICEAGSRLVAGKLGVFKQTVTYLPPEIPQLDTKFLPLNSDDVYKELRLQGYEYQGIFKGIKSVENNGKSARIGWNGNWISFLDTMMQFSIVSKDSRGLYLPTRIQKLSIDPIYFEQMLENNSTLQIDGLPVSYSKEMESIKCHGIEINGLRTTRTARKLAKNQNLPILEEARFIPYMNKYSPLSKENAIKFLTDLVLENSTNHRLQIQERADHLCKAISPSILQSIRSQPLRQAEIKIISEDSDATEVKDYLEQTGCVVITLQKLVKSSTFYLIVLDLNTECTQDISNSLKPGGFVLFHSETELTQFPDQLHGLNLVSEINGSGYSNGLFRKPIEANLSEPQTIIVQNGECESWLPQIQSAMKMSADNENYPRIFLVSSGNPDSGIVGLVNCLRLEPGGHKIRCIFYKDGTSQGQPQLDPTILRNDMKMNVIDKDGVIGSYRHIPIVEELLRFRETARAFVNVETVGDLSSLKFIQAPLSTGITVKDMISCEVFYSALNFRDVMIATGRLAQESLPGKLGTDRCVLGLEFAGTDRNQNRVMGMVEARGMATHVMADPAFLWEIPRNWTMEEAATVPVAYCTAYYSLITRGRLRSGESVLIHSGSGGVGQSAIAIALSMKCIVYTTVGSPDKKLFLMDRFPELKETSFSNSRDTSFEDHVIQQTSGRGVDLILNSLAEEKLQASLRCLAEGGRFLEIGKFDLSKNNALGMEIFLKNVTFHGILLDSLFGKSCMEKLELVDLMKNGIASGIVQPLKRIVFENNQIEEAFRFMASGKHIGKVLLRMRDEVNVNEESQSNPTLPIKATVRTYFDHTKVYIIVGGLGGFGLELAGWMIQREAKNLVLVSRSKVKNGYQALQIRRWEDAGIKVMISHSDVTEMFGAKELIQMAEQSGRIGGIFNLAMILKDGEISDQTVDTFEAVIKPKLQATANLDAISRGLCPDLDHFVVFSSAASGRGNFGQSNYGFANSAIERICESRKSDNLPGLAIQWAAIGDVGVAHEMLGSNDVALCGTMPQRLSSCLEVLDLFLNNASNFAVVSTMVLPEGSNPGCSTSSDKPSLVDSVAKILGLKNGAPISNRGAKLGDWGIDSLTVVELKQLLETFCDMTFSVGDIRELTWARLEELEAEVK